LGRGAEGKEQGTLNSPLLPLANLLPCSSKGFERCGEKSGLALCFKDYRDINRIDHSINGLIAQRIYGLRDFQKIKSAINRMIIIFKGREKQPLAAPLSPKL